MVINTNPLRTSEDIWNPRVFEYDRIPEIKKNQEINVCLIQSYVVQRLCLYGESFEMSRWRRMEKIS